MLFKVIVLLLFLPLLSGCYYDNEEELAPCRTDAGTVRYLTAITPLFEKYGCYDCHVGSAPQGGISLQGYSFVKALVDNGKLLGAITHAEGFAPMPQAAAKMSDCDISKVKAWIDAGAPEY